MPTERLISIVVGSAIMAAVLYIVVWPHIRRALLLRSGVSARARVKHIERTHVRDEKKRYLHKVALEVQREGGTTYSV